MSGKRLFGRQEVADVDPNPQHDSVWPLLKDIPIESKMEAAQMMFPPWQAPVEKVKPPPVWVTLCFVYCDVLCFNASVLEQLLCLVATENSVFECSYYFCRIH